MTHSLADPVSGILARLPPDEAALLREALAEAAAPRWRSRGARLDKRDAAIRDALGSFYTGLPPSTAAKALERDFCAYLSGGWLRERVILELAPAADAKRRALHRIARLSDGGSLGWRQIVNINEGARGG